MFIMPSPEIALHKNKRYEKGNNGSLSKADAERLLDVLQVASSLRD